MTSQKRAADTVVEAIERRIQTGALSEGQPLPPERDLMREFAISRTVAREAVVALANKGLVHARPRYRPVVRKPGYESAIHAVGGIVSHLLGEPGGVRNLFDTRIMIEAGLVREAAQRATRDDIKALTEALGANEMAIADSDRFYDTDVAFHGVLYRVPGNPVFPALHRAYTHWLSGHWKQMPRLPDRNRRNYEAHARIMDAILLRDPDSAEAALRDHLDQAWKQVRATFDEL